MAHPPAADCLVCRKHPAIESVAGGAIHQNDLVCITHAQLWRDETVHYLGHVLVETRRHVSGLAGLTPDEAREVGTWMPRLSQILLDVCQAEHVYAYVIGDEVRHFHLHLIARYPGTPREFWGMRVCEWPAAPRGAAPEIADLARRLRDALAVG